MKSVASTSNLLDSVEAYQIWISPANSQRPLLSFLHIYVTKKIMGSSTLQFPLAWKKLTTILASTCPDHKHFQELGRQDHTACGSDHWMNQPTEKQPPWRTWKPPASWQVKSSQVKQRREIKSVQANCTIWDKPKSVKYNKTAYQ